MKNVKEGLIISCLQSCRENEQILMQSSLLLLATVLDDLSSTSNMAARKQNTFQDSKKSAYCLNLKLNSARSFPRILAFINASNSKTNQWIFLAQTTMGTYRLFEDIVVSSNIQFILSNSSRLRGC